MNQEIIQWMLLAAALVDQDPKREFFGKVLSIPEVAWEPGPRKLVMAMRAGRRSVTEYLAEFKLLLGPEQKFLDMLFEYTHRRGKKAQFDELINRAKTRSCDPDQAVAWLRNELDKIAE